MIEIEMDDIRLIMQRGRPADDYRHFEKVVDNCFCRRCPSHLTTIVEYKAYLNSLQDILLKGKCEKCGNPVNRYIETGENKNHADIAKHIQAIIQQYKAI